MITFFSSAQYLLLALQEADVAIITFLINFRIQAIFPKNLCYKINGTNCLKNPPSDLVKYKSSALLCHCTVTYDQFDNFDCLLYFQIPLKSSDWRRNEI